MFWFSIVVCTLFFFFFKQKTAYEMRISDWSSDVCSSDLAADDEVTRRRNRAAFDACDLIPRVLAGVDSVDMRTTLFGREMAMPLFLSPTALQRLFHWQGERAVLRAAAKAGTVAGISSLATRSEEHTSELQSLMRISYAVFCLKKKNKTYTTR